MSRCRLTRSQHELVRVALLASSLASLPGILMLAAGPAVAQVLGAAPTGVFALIALLSALALRADVRRRRQRELE